MKQVWKHSARNPFVGCQCLPPPICFSLRQPRNRKKKRPDIKEFEKKKKKKSRQLTSTLLAQSGYLGSFGTSHWPVTPSRPVDENDRQSRSDSTFPHYSSFIVEHQWDQMFLVLMRLWESPPYLLPSPQLSLSLLY